jgi:thiol:disulfide interchange protein
LASSYVVCMALVYAALGVLAALLGGNLAAWLQTPWILGSFAALFVLLALPMFGFFELQLPAFLRDRLDNVSRQQSGGSLVGAGILGALSGLLVGPCMTAPLAGALLYIAQSGNALHGGLILFAMGIGIGIPLLLLVTVGNRFLPKPGTWMNAQGWTPPAVEQRTQDQRDHARPGEETAVAQVDHLQWGLAVIAPVHQHKADAGHQHAQQEEHEAAGKGSKLQALEKIPADIEAKLDGNMKLMDGLELSATPAIFYLDDKGGLQQQQGAPSPEKLGKILGPK